MERPAGPNAHAERDLVAAILHTFGAQPGLRLWRSNTGAARTHTGALVRFGVPGQADISGVLAPHGQRIEIECKAPHGRQSAQQRKFQTMIEAHGGVYVLARSIEDVATALRAPP